MKKNLLSASFFLCLNACSNKPYEFEGTYLLTKGEQCTLDAKDDDTTFMGITAHGQGSSKFYTAKIPMGATLGFPTSSDGNSSPTEKNELNFSFSKEGKSGLFGKHPSVDMSITVTPHESKKDSIWLTKWEAAVIHKGEMKQLSPLQGLKDHVGQQGNAKTSEKGVCLSKKV